MNGITYAVVTRGLLDGATPGQVKKKLERVLKAHPDIIDRIMEARPFVIKKGLDQETARKYREVLTGSGIKCDIEKAPSQEPMICPKCGFRQPPSKACARCGVIIEKYQKRHEDNGANGPYLEKEQSANPYKLVSNPQEFFRKIRSFKGGWIGVAIVAVFLLLTVFDFYWLRGELVARRSFPISSHRNFLELKVKKVSEPHLVRVYTRKKQKLHIRLLGPDGNVLYDDTEYGRHKGERFFRFIPQKRGKYRVCVSVGPLSFSTYNRVIVSVYVNDRRILPKILGHFNI